MFLFTFPDYIDHIYDTMTTAVKARGLEAQKVQLKDVAPPPLNNGFETKGADVDAIKKRN